MRETDGNKHLTELDGSWLLNHSSIACFRLYWNTFPCHGRKLCHCTAASAPPDAPPPTPPALPLHSRGCWSTALPPLLPPPPPPSSINGPLTCAVTVISRSASRPRITEEFIPRPGAFQADKSPLQTIIRTLFWASTGWSEWSVATETRTEEPSFQLVVEISRLALLVITVLSLSSHGAK